MKTFTQLNLLPPILKALEKAGYTQPTDIQKQAIPPLMEGRDLLGIAQTGTGKTAAFALPVLQRLSSKKTSVWPGNTRAVILAPTRELASQIYESFNTYGKNLGLKYLAIFGGIPQRSQVTAMKQGVDVLIATPGRLIDLMKQGEIRFDQTEVFVLDEADRMMDMGFIDDIRLIASKISSQHQTLLFSATMPKQIAHLAKQLLNNPVHVEISPQSTTVDAIQQQVIYVLQRYKTEVLRNILLHPDVDQALVFCRTKIAVDQVYEELIHHGVAAAAIHSDKHQRDREIALQEFKDGQLTALIATDIASRGIDVDGVSHVINFDVPTDPESYVHRIGRTARAGNTGIAITLSDEPEYELLDAIEEAISCNLEEVELESFESK